MSMTGIRTVQVLQNPLAKFVEDDWGGSYELTGLGYGLIAVCLIGFLVLAVFLAGKKTKGRVFSVKRLVFSAAALSIAYIASEFLKFDLPWAQGGSITAMSMLFVTLIGYWFGLSAGLTAAVAYGLLQLIAGPYIVSLPQMLFDYILAFGALGLSGAFSQAKHGLIKGYIFGVCGRFFFSFLSGWIFFATYTDYEVFGKAFAVGPVAYSILYNLSYMLPELIVTLILLAIPAVDKAMQHVKKIAVSE